MIAPPFVRRQDIVAQAKFFAHALPLEMERMQRRVRPRREERYRVAEPLGLEKLPDSGNLHKVRRLALDFLHHIRKFERTRVALRQRLFEIPPEAEVPPEEHVRVDVA